MSDTPDVQRWIERELTARADQLEPAFEVDDLLEQIDEALEIPGRSPVLVGEPGVGKTAVVHELVRRLARGEGPVVLRDRPILQVSVRGIAGLFPPQERAKAADAFRELLDHVREDPARPVLYLRDLHGIYALDWEALLYQHLAQDGTRVIGEATPHGFDRMVEYHADLASHLVSVPMTEPDRERTARMVAAWCTGRQAAGGRAVTPRARKLVLELTARFLGNQRFPRKAIELLRQTVDLAGAADRPVDVPDVVSRFARRTRVPPMLVHPDEPLDLDALQGFLAGRLLGQDEAVEAVVRMVALVKTGLVDERRPFGVLLFVGPTGVGKTHTAQLLAEYLFGRRDRMIRVNMADLRDENAVLTLFGNPHAHDLASKRGLLTQRLAGHPFGVLLLDELEKAHEKVHDALLQLVDEGRFINGASEVVSATSLIVIATSNAGAEVYRRSGIGFGGPVDREELDRELDRRLLDSFRFEFLNRFDRVVHFHPLQRTHIREIARRELADLGARDGLTLRDLRLESDVEVLDWLVAHGYHPHYGARFLRREIERHVTGAVADAVLRLTPTPGATLRLGVRGGHVRVTLATNPDARVAAPVPTATGSALRALEPEEVREQARAWLVRWVPRRREHDARQAEADALMARSLEPGFWDDAAHAGEILRRYKALDARLQADARLLRPVERLAESLREDRLPASPEGLLRRVDDAWDRWTRLDEDDAGDAAWVVLRPADGTRVARTWIDELTRAYLAFARRQGWTAEPVAEEPRPDGADLVVLEVEGAGCVEALQVEHGEHQRLRRGERQRARVQVVARRTHGADAALPEGVHLEQARRARGHHVAHRAWRLRMAWDDTGDVAVLEGPDGDTLRLLALDLDPVWREPGTEVVRTYGGKGGVVQDPRTGHTHASLKDVLRGDLRAFGEAWRARGRQRQQGGDR